MYTLEAYRHAVLQFMALQNVIVVLPSVLY